ncbi:MAG: heme-binding protein [Pseudomonadota bacterium]|nr:heme-binding protein [Pseudomonadota bacterium]
MLPVRVALLCTVAWLTACSGGGGGSSSAALPIASAAFLTVEDVQRVTAQAVGEARARGVAAHVAVVDRVGNVLVIFRMTGAGTSTIISSGLGVTGGLEGAGVSSMDAAVSKAITAAYLSSGGNAFTTRTANQIIQEHFNPGESQQPSGPLYGVQFSQLACSDVIATGFGTTIGPRPSPLGLAADPGAVPLYKDGVLVGAVGVEVDGRYGIDRDIFDVDGNIEEAIAVAGSFRFEAPADIRADRITADGRTLRFVDSVSLAADPANAPAFAALPGELVGLVPYNSRTLGAGTEFGTASSGIRPATGDREGPWILVDAAGNNRFPARDPNVFFIPFGGELARAEVEVLLQEAYAVARRTRAQIRRPLGARAEVTISVVDFAGQVLGIIRTPDAPVFGIDVAVQKARTAAFFSSGGHANLFPAVDAARAFVGTGSFDGVAWSSRAIGNLHRPFFPDGIEGSPHGPFSTPIASWSPFNVGFQEDLILNQLVNALNADVSKGCVGRDLPGSPPASRSDRGIANGIQIFPGGVPIYRVKGPIGMNGLIGAIGVSGDGVDQDDMIAFLGLANAGRRLGTGIGNAPAAMRADRFAPLGTRLRYVQCPQAPFVDSSEQNVCAGL